MNRSKHQKYFQLAAITCAMLGMHNGFAASRVDLSNPAQRDSAGAAFDLRPTSSSVNTVDGGRKVKYRQYHEGVPVWGEAPPVAQFAPGRNGAVSDTPAFVSGTLVDGIAADLPAGKPKLSQANARQIMQSLIASQGGNIAQAENEKIELMVRLDKNNRAQFIYIVDVFLHGDHPSRPTFILDANTGAVIDSWDGLAHRDATGVGGNEKLGKYHYGTEYKPLSILDNCTYDGPDVMTIDMQNGTASITTPFKLADCPATGTPNNDQRAVNGAYSPENDGHGYGNVVFNMYRDWYGIRPISQKLTVRVHYGNQYSNAFWNGQSMTFGDGGNSMYPLVSLGVMAHEVSHGFTQQNSGLIYKGMSGGMNEAFSDMAAQAAEEYLFGKPTLLVGPEIVKAAGKALRYMENPEQDGRSIGHASKFTSTLNVHYSSGVYNKAFALLVKQYGWTARKAFEVFMGANALYWKAGSTFNEGACGVIQATKDKGYSSADVINAFQQVGVSCDGAGGGGGGGGNTGATPVALTSGVALTGQNIAAGAQSLYTITVSPQASFLAVRTGGGNGDVGVYVKAGGTPTTTSFDASSTTAGNAESVLIKNPTAGVYTVLVTGSAATSGLSIIAVTR